MGKHYRTKKTYIVDQGTDSGNTPIVVENINHDGGAGTLDSSYYKGCGERQGIEREVVCIGNGQVNQAQISDKVGSLNCMHDQQAIMTYQDIIGAVDCCISKGTSNQLGAQDMFVANKSIVRRLTPKECERLQAFPDDWTNIGEWIDSKGKVHKPSDSNRYKALGNSIALCWWEWMAEKMLDVFDEETNDDPTMASLFDGIGGFPLVYSRHGCEPVWASEIEEFPIAVTKVRFPE